MIAPRVIQISDRNRLGDDEMLRRIAIADGRMAVQLRDPELSGRRLLAWGKRLRAATAAVGAGLVVNDRLDLALVLGADGVHLGRRSPVPEQARRLVGSGIWCSMSAHSLEDIDRAADAGADAVLFSPIFPSPGKAKLQGLEGLEAAVGHGRKRGMALFALGGVGPETAAQCLALGADGVAAIRADLTALLHRGHGR